jgi:WD40 repeat protein
MLPPLQGHDGHIYSVAFSPDGSKIISGSYDKTIRVWDASTLASRCCHRFKAIVSYDSFRRILARWIQNHLGVLMTRPFEFGTQALASRCSHLFEVIMGSIYSVAFSPDGSKIISGSSDKTIRVWDASTGIEMLPPFEAMSTSVNSVAFSPDGFKIISGSDDKTIRLWDASTGGEMLPPPQGHGDRICSVAFSPDGSKIISGS